MKVVLSLATLCMCGQGSLSLDADISEFVPELSPGGQTGITVRHLLSSTEGYVEPTDPRARWAWTWDDLVSFFPARLQAYEAGRVWSYNHTGYAILARCLERACGQSIGDILDQIVWVPLGLKPFAFGTLPGERADEIALHVRSPRVGDYQPMRAPRETGLLRYSISDFSLSISDLSFFADVLAGKQVPGAGHLQEAVGLMMSERINLPRYLGGRYSEAMPSAFGLGLADYGGYLGINGSYVGSTAALRFSRTNGNSAVVALNAWLPGIRDRLAKVLIYAVGSASDKAETRTSIPLPLSNYVGHYQGLMLGSETASVGRAGSDFLIHLHRQGAGSMEATVSQTPDGDVVLREGSRDITIALHVVDGMPVLMVGSSAYKKVG